MKSGKCPKCGSSQVYTGAHLSQWAKGGTYFSNAIPITTWWAAPLDNYVCVDCGYVESYISDRSRLDRIVQNWPRVDEMGEASGTWERRDRADSRRGRERSCPNCGASLEKGWKACPTCGQPLV